MKQNKQSNMSNTAAINQNPSALEQAKSLPMPSREAMLRRDHSVAFFWNYFSSLLEEAWKEWDSNSRLLPQLDETLFEPKLREAVEAAWEDPSKEDLVKDLWEEVAPGVYMCQIIDPSQIDRLATYLKEVSEAQIPLRPPYGIQLNRKGFMLDERSEGYLASPKFQHFYKTLLMDQYVRPLARFLWKEYASPETDSETFAFSIGYQPGGEENIREHMDSSSYTFNLNINRPGEKWTGSGLIFYDERTGKQYHVDHKPGCAVFHRGATLHAALPIESGTRSNLVCWLYGRNRQMCNFPADKIMTPNERWTIPAEVAPEDKDTWTPF